MRLKWMLLLILTLIVSHGSLAGNKALLIMDMQDGFINRENYQILNDNPQKLRRLLEKQKQAINVAKTKRIPIYIVEYKNREYTPTHHELIEAIGDYPANIIYKTSDALFGYTHPDDGRINSLVEPFVNAEFRERNITDLVIIGANGGSCVLGSIRGALEVGYVVWAYNDGLADFNFQEFIYPFRYYEQQGYWKITDDKFHENDDLSQIFSGPLGTVNKSTKPRIIKGPTLY